MTETSASKVTVIRPRKPRYVMPQTIKFDPRSMAAINAWAERLKQPLARAMRELVERAAAGELADPIAFDCLKRENEELRERLEQLQLRLDASTERHRRETAELLQRFEQERAWPRDDVAELLSGFARLQIAHTEMRSDADANMATMADQISGLSRAVNNDILPVARAAMRERTLVYARAATWLGVGMLVACATILLLGPGLGWMLGWLGWTN